MLLLSPEKAELMQRFRIDNKRTLGQNLLEHALSIPLLSEPSLQPKFEILMRQLVLSCAYE